MASAYGRVGSSKGVLSIPSRIIASCFALVGFAAAAVVGIAVGNSAVTIIGRATLVMLASYVIGRAVGAIAQHTIDDHISRYQQKHPLHEETNDVKEHREDEAEPDSGQAVSST